MVANLFLVMDPLWISLSLPAVLATTRGSSGDKMRCCYLAATRCWCLGSLWPWGKLQQALPADAGLPVAAAAACPASGCGRGGAAAGQTLFADLLRCAPWPPRNLVGGGGTYPSKVLPMVGLVFRNLSK